MHLIPRTGHLSIYPRALMLGTNRENLIKVNPLVWVHTFMPLYGEIRCSSEFSISLSYSFLSSYFSQGTL